jgi:hypothetical protein
MGTPVTTVSLQDDLESSYRAGKSMARGLAEGYYQDPSRARIAKAFCGAMLDVYWKVLCREQGTSLRLKPAPASNAPLNGSAAALAAELGELLARFPSVQAGYMAGSIYTVMLPDAIRTRVGAYYTPSALVERLLDLAESAGFDFSKDTAIDPACGGGAFLAPVAVRMWKRGKTGSAELVLRRIASRIRGIEIDPFAAWMSQTLLEAALLPLCLKAGMRMPEVVTVGDALNLDNIGRFGLVIGNPPYGRTTLDVAKREKYKRSLFGHANLYGVFTDLALRLCRPNGLVAYVTPTSFLGGQYFKALRGLLLHEAKPVAIDFVADREGVFDDVLQETLLAAYRRGEHDSLVAVSAITPHAAGRLEVQTIGNFSVKGEEPWLLPRSRQQARFFRRLRTIPTRLKDLGYRVSTGPLVWNRHKHQLRFRPGKTAFPLIWAESVNAERFRFSAARRNHVPFIEVYAAQPHLLTRKPCVLIQRTTAKEQDRRLVAAVLPAAFLRKHKAVVIENHLNMIYCSGEPAIRFETLCALFNTKTVDHAFRCISGSVAVSAYELNALPLPSLEELRQLERLVLRGASPAVIEKQVARFYGNGI